MAQKVFKKVVKKAKKGGIIAKKSVGGTVKKAQKGGSIGGSAKKAQSGGIIKRIGTSAGNFAKGAARGKKKSNAIRKKRQ